MSYAILGHKQGAMTVLFWVTYGVLWVMMGVLVVLVLLLYRQFGLMIMPGSQRVSYGGLDVGSAAPVITVRPAGRPEIAFDWSDPSPGDHPHEATFALFAMPGCPLCDALSFDETITTLDQKYPSVRFVWIDGTRDPVHQIPAGWTVAGSHHGDAHQAMELPGTPFAYLISNDRHVLAKGIVNNAADIDVLLTGSFSPARGKPRVKSLAAPLSDSGQMEGP
jgi:hypothetical protein